MHTPSLARRVTSSAILVFVLLATFIAVFVLLTVRGQLESALADVLEARADLAEELAATGPIETLAARLQALGITSTVTAPDGAVYLGEPPVPRFAPGPPGPWAERAERRDSLVVEMPDGTRIEVFATRTGVETTLRRTMTAVAIGTAVALVGALLLFRQGTTLALAPLGQVVEAARRRAAGQHGERLHPDDPHTELGVVAAAYDAMLDELEAAIDAARDAEERTRGFLADAAHQLRTPIAGIRASVESLLREADQAQRDELTLNLVRETTRASRVLQSLLTLARYDTGHVPLRAPTDLAAICQAETERAESLAPHLEFRMHGAGSPIYLQIDGTAIREALANLLDNARRHARTCVQVTLDECSGGVSIRIDDDGAGLADGTEEEIFERFVSHDDGGGSGLGLPIAREVARSHGGELFYDHGFVLQLPDAP